MDKGRYMQPTKAVVGVLVSVIFLPRFRIYYINFVRFRSEFRIGDKLQGFGIICRFVSGIAFDFVLSVSIPFHSVSSP